MNIKESTVEQDGSCNYCDKGGLSIGDTINFPYDKVLVVEGKSIKSNFCEECFNELQNHK